MMYTSARKTILIVALMVMLAGCDGVPGFGRQGSGQEATQSREVGTFDRIEVRGQTDLEVTSGDTSVTVRGDDNLLDEVSTEVSGGTLVIDESRALRPRAGLVVEVTVPVLAGVTLQGSGEGAVSDVAGEASFDATVQGSGNLDVDGVTSATFTGTVSGSGGVEVTGVDVQTFTTSVSGSGGLEASGRADQIDVSVSGSGSAQLQDLEARQATVDVSGSGDAEVQVSDTLEASASGSGDIRYSGEPRNVRESSSGSGEVRPQ